MSHIPWGINVSTHAHAHCPLQSTLPRAEHKPFENAPFTSTTLFGPKSLSTQGVGLLKLHTNAASKNKRKTTVHRGEDNVFPQIPTEASLNRKVTTVPLVGTSLKRHPPKKPFERHPLEANLSGLLHNLRKHNEKRTFF